MNPFYSVDQVSDHLFALKSAFVHWTTRAS